MAVLPLLLLEIIFPSIWFEAECVLYKLGTQATALFPSFPSLYLEGICDGPAIRLDLTSAGIFRSLW